MTDHMISDISPPHLLVIGGITAEMREAVSSDFILHDYFDSDDKPGLIGQYSEQIEGILTNGHDGVPDLLISKLPHLKIISCYGVGYDAIDVKAASERNIIVTHTPNVLNEEVAITAILLLFSVARQLPLAMRWIKDGHWASQGHAPLSTSPHGMKVGLVGYGRIGQTIADRLRMFGCHISYHSRHEKSEAPDSYVADLTEMASACDALIVITPGGPSTHHLITADVLDALGPDGILVNVARGSVVDEEALVDSLVHGRLGGAGLDVFADEPHVPKALLDMEQVICTPHIGSATVETRAAMGRLTTDNLKLFFAEGRVISSVPETAHLLEDN